jgi:hypothetical protein
MNRHLDDQEIAAVASGVELEGWPKDHLASCLSCQQEVRALRTMVDTRREQLVEESPDWKRQKQEILLRLPQVQTSSRVQRSRWFRPLLAAAAVVLVAVGLGVLRPSSQNGGDLTGEEVPVEQILADVDAILADDSIPGFESIDPGVQDLEAVFENGAS